MCLQTFFPTHRGSFTDGPVGNQRHRSPFNDERLYKRFKQLQLLFRHTSGYRLTDLSDDRAEQVAADRFLNNPRVGLGELIYRATTIEPAMVRGRSYLTYLDAVVINVALSASGRPELLQTLGCIDNQGVKPGYTAMPAVVVDRESKMTIGVSDMVIHQRPVHHPDPEQNKRLRAQRAHLAYEDKESSSWAIAVTNTMDQLWAAEQVCFVCDQGSDTFEFYEYFTKWTNAEFILRAKTNREVQLYVHGPRQRLEQVFGQQAVVASKRQFIIGLDHFSKTAGKQRRRLGRIAQLDLRYWTAWVCPPATNDGPNGVDESRALAVTYVDVCEAATTVPPGESPIHWRLVTNGSVVSPADAWQVVADYASRWTIEQLFRILKLDGLNLEKSQLDNPLALQRLLVMSVSAAVRVQQLVQLRQGDHEVALSTLFDAVECEVLTKLNRQLEGKTAKLSNPHPPQSAAFGSWVVARLGGWSGYASEKPPGYERMMRGYIRLMELVEFYPILNGS